MNEHVCRRLVLLLDGTWNEDDEDHPATNIVYLRERLFWGLQSRLRRKQSSDVTQFNALPPSIKQKGVTGLMFDGFEYIVYYDRGVGTGALLDVIKGGLTGDGLDDNIREAYRFLSFWFRPGDEIFVFGFSRGAFTARSLCGYLQAAGLLRCDQCNEDNEKRAWKFYRTPPGERLSADWLYFRSAEVSGGVTRVHDENTMRVRALGVFDTVGALGIPAEGLRRLNRAKYEFHDPEANSIVDIRLHAVAIDEPRKAFAPTLWTKPKFKKVSQTRSPTEQVWFPGAHADIGGGYVKWNQKDFGLAHLPLAWMLQRLRYHLINTPHLASVPANLKLALTPDRNVPIPFYIEDLLDFDDPAAALKYGPPIKGDVRSLSVFAQHMPWAVVTSVRPGIRLINQLPLPKPASDEQQGRVPHADPIGETIHVSALERLRSGQPIKIEKGRVMNLVDGARKFVGLLDQRYRPHNLVSVIPYIAATYLDTHKINSKWQPFVAEIYSWKHVRVTDWDGKILDPEHEDDVKRVFEILPVPGDIGVTKIPEEMTFIKLPDIISERRRLHREGKPAPSGDDL